MPRYVQNTRFPITAGGVCHGPRMQCIVALASPHQERLEKIHVTVTGFKTVIQGHIFHATY